MSKENITMLKIENWNEECATEIPTRPKSETNQPKTTNGSYIQQDYSTPGDRIRLALKNVNCFRGNELQTYLLNT